MSTHHGRDFIFTSESVTEGHPDKLCDQISDTVLDIVLRQEAELEAAGYVSARGERADLSQARCACETLATTGLILVAGELRTQSYVNIESTVRDVIREVGYNSAECGFDADTCSVLTALHGQSLDIALGVDESHETKAGVVDGTDPLDLVGAGDQGMMFGYAVAETPTLMPMPIYLAHRLAQRLTAVRKDGTLDYLRPDGKTQVTVGYEDGRPARIEKIVLSTQHAAAMDSQEAIRRDVERQVIAPVLDEAGIPWRDAELYVNPTGRFVVGGPMGDCGLTGRKIIVDTYGGMGRHGGGAFSGKDCTKVDRSGAYAARWVAKNVVASGLADECEVQFAYAIGVARPLSLMVDACGSEHVPVSVIEEAVRRTFDLRPGAIIRDLDLRRPIFSKTAAYGHFGREDPDFTWERTDRVEALRAAAADQGYEL